MLMIVLPHFWDSEGNETLTPFVTSPLTSYAVPSYEVHALGTGREDADEAHRAQGDGPRDRLSHVRRDLL